MPPVELAQRLKEQKEAERRQKLVYRGVAYLKS